MLVRWGGGGKKESWRCERRVELERAPDGFLFDLDGSSSKSITVQKLDLKINVITHELDSPYIENHCTGVFLGPFAFLIIK